MKIESLILCFPVFAFPHSSFSVCTFTVFSICIPIESTARYDGLRDVMQLLEKRLLTRNRRMLRKI